MFVYKKGGVERGGGYHDFLSESFCRSVPKKLVAESFRVSLFPDIGNFYA